MEPPAPCSKPAQSTMHSPPALIYGLGHAVWVPWSLHDQSSGIPLPSPSTPKGHAPLGSGLNSTVPTPPPPPPRPTGKQIIEECSYQVSTVCLALCFISFSSCNPVRQIPLLPAGWATVNEVI